MASVLRLPGSAGVASDVAAPVVAAAAPPAHQLQLRGIAPAAAHQLAALQPLRCGVTGPAEGLKLLFFYLYFLFYLYFSLFFVLFVFFYFLFYLYIIFSSSLNS